MVHVTCLAHGLHRISEEICSYLDIIDDLVANVKKYSENFYIVTNIQNT